MFTDRTPPADSLDAGLDAGLGSDPTLSCMAEPSPCPGGNIVVLYLVGEIDLLSDPVLRAALDSVLGGTTGRARRHVVVDLAGVTFCCVRGFALLADAGRNGAATGVGYAISGLSPSLRRLAQLLWTDPPPLPRYASAAAAVTTIRADLVTEHRLTVGPEGG